MRAFITSLAILVCVLCLIPVFRLRALRRRGDDVVVVAKDDDDAPEQLISATRAYKINEKDPLIVSRAYFTEDT